MKRFIYRILAVTASVLCTYPLFAFFCGFRRYDTLYPMIFTVMTLVSAVMGMMLARISEHIEIRAELLGRICSKLFCLLPPAVMYFLTYSFRPDMSFIMLVVSLIASFFGSGAVYREYSDIFSSQQFATNVVVSVLSAFILHLADKEYSVISYCTVLVITAVLFLFICTESGIDRNMQRINRKNTKIPSQMHSYTRKLTIFTILFSTLLLGIYPLLRFLIAMLKKLGLLLISAVMRFSEWLASLYDTPVPMADEEAAEQIVDSTAYRTASVLSDIFSVVCVLLIFGLIFYNRENIYSGIVRAVRKVQSFIMSAFSLEPPQNYDTSMPYYDRTEFTDPVRTEKKSGRRPEAYYIKKRIGSYRKMKDGEEKFRVGTKIAADIAKPHSEDLTVREILGEVSEELVSVYEMCRYDGKYDGGGCELTDSVIGKLSQNALNCEISGEISAEQKKSK